jgi:dTMP kinase
MSGLFIAFEGGEGVGKSTQEAILGAYLEQQGHSVVRTREPGGTPAAEAIRHLVLSHDYDGLNPRSEALLFAAARGDHVVRVIRPALERGDVVICDRFIDSSVAYQGVARQLGVDWVRNLSLWATNNLIPDLTIVLTIDPEVSLARVTNHDRLESEPLEYHRSVTQAFLDLAAQEPSRYLVVDASQEIDVISQMIRVRVDQELASPS